MITHKVTIRAEQWSIATDTCSGLRQPSFGHRARSTSLSFLLMVSSSISTSTHCFLVRFKDQLCKLKFGSWTYDAAQVNLTKRRRNVDMTNYIRSGEWHVVNIGVKRNDVTYPCCPGIYYPDVTIYSKTSFQTVRLAKSDKFQFTFGVGSCTICLISYFLVFGFRFFLCSAFGCRLTPARKSHSALLFY